MSKKLQKKGVLLMILLATVTYGIYVPIWFLNRRDSFNKLKSKRKISNGPMTVVLVLYIISAIILVPSFLFARTSLGITIDNIDSAISIFGIITILITSFKIRRILIDHYKTNISWVATFVFSFFYLQYKINRLIEKK
jgi:hypothetical protein